jgi:hypothetical protein
MELKLTLELEMIVKKTFLIQLVQLDHAENIIV